MVKSLSILRQLVQRIVELFDNHALGGRFPGAENLFRVLSISCSDANRVSAGLPDGVGVMGFMRPALAAGPAQDAHGGCPILGAPPNFAAISTSFRTHASSRGTLTRPT